jgi:TRAP-type C4-dicarboxylate transport system permease large subunit
VGASVFNLFVVLTGLPRVIAAFILGFNLPPMVIMIIILLFFFILGTFMDALAMVLLMVPIFFPVIENLGFDPIHFGVLVTMMMTIGHVTPPFGIVCFAISGVAQDVSLMTIFRGVAPFLYAMVGVLILVLFFPALSLYLPELMMG